MKIENFDGNTERSILIGMIVSSKFLSSIFEIQPSQDEPPLFSNKWSNLVSSWCFRHYAKYKKAPNASIESIYARWANKSKDQSTIDLVEKFLSNLDKQYASQRKKINPFQLLDIAIEYFNKIKLQRLKDEVEQLLDDGQVQQAEQKTLEFKRIEIATTDFCNPYLDPDIHKSVYSARNKPLIKYPGALGQFFGDQLARENFIAFQAPEGSGKSFWLQEICHTGAKQKLKVLFFGIGDMSLVQTIRRYQARLCRRPIRKEKYYYPVGWKSKDADGYVLPKRKKKFTKAPLTLEEIETARRKFQQYCLQTDHNLFKLSCSSSISVSEIRTSINKLIQREGWQPDIIAIDYADLLEPPPRVNDKLDQIDENWRQLRYLALEFQALVVTATQVKRTAYNKLWQELGDVADQKKKAAHVTGLIGLNFRLPEHTKEVRRLNWIKLRETTPRRTVCVAGCFAVANPCILSI